MPYREGKTSLSPRVHPLNRFSGVQIASNRKNRNCEGVAKEMEAIQASLQSFDSALRNASRNNGSLLSRLQEIATVNEEILDPLSTMANEVKEVSQKMRLALNAVEISSRSQEKQIAAMNLFETCLRTELDGIKTTADDRCRGTLAPESTR